MPLIPGAESFGMDYAGMDFAVLVSWIGVATLIGYLARIATSGRKIIGLWGDMAIALVGGFLVGTLMRILSVDLSSVILSAAPGLGARYAVLFDVALALLIGAFVLRFGLRLVGGRG